MTHLFSKLSLYNSARYPANAARPLLEIHVLQPRQVFTLAAATALAPVAIDLYLPSSVGMARELGVDAGAAGLAVSVFLFGLAAGQLVIGPLSDRVGRRPTILGGLACFILAAGVASQANSLPVLLTARLFQALGACSVLLSSRAMVSDRLDPPSAARLFSMLSLIGGAAPVLAPIIGALLAELGGWRACFFFMAVFGFTVLTAATVLLPESRSAETSAAARSESPVEAYLTLLKNREFQLYLIAGGANGAAFFTYLGNSASVFQDVYGVSPFAFSIMVALNAGALVWANQINRRLLKQHSLLAVLRMSGRNAGLLAAAFALMALSGVTALPLLLGLVFLMVGSVAPVQANTLASVMGIGRARAGSAGALLGAAIFALGALASSIAGYFYDHTARPLTLVTAVFLAITSLALG
ncbi:MAG: Bcr/CflA family drug resistance efflux transporter, partial [Alphaproteobacteria bacterium PA3]